MGVAGNIKKHIFDLENALLTEEVRKNENKLNQLISDNFIEFGQSGKIYKKSDILESLPKEEFEKITITDFEIISSQSNQIAVRYKSSFEDNITLRSSIWKKEEDDWKIIFHQGTKIENKPILFIICGMPASGKTTFTKKIIEKYGAIHLSEDEWMKDLISMYDNDEIRDNVAGLHRKFASQLLAKSVNIVMDGGYYSAEERDELKNIAKNSGANTELHYLKTDFSIINSRRIERNKNFKKEFRTTEENLKRAKKYFCEPTAKENPIIHVNNNIILRIVEYDSPKYFEATTLREDILRKPLGLGFKKEELEQDKNHIHIIATINEKIIGTCALAPLNNKTLKMQRVAIKEDFQNKGIGTLLLKFCEEYVIDFGYQELYCHARDSAIPFYEKHNFIAEGDLFDEDGTTPHLRMRKILQTQNGK